MQAMLFAAGLGTRLYPITKDKPKALAPFGNSTLLAYNLQFLSKQGVRYFVINTHHFADKIQDYLKENNNFGLNIKISYEPELLDTAGGLAKAKSLFHNDGDILLYNVDVVSNIDIKAFHKIHLNNNALATLAVRTRETSRYLLFDMENRLVGWRNKSSGEEKWCSSAISNTKEYAFSGVHWVNSAIFNKLKPEKKSLVPFYLDNGKDNDIIAFDHSNDLWFDCGKPESLATAEKSVFQ
jgi:NDP-sugar pyrophosphorylase family protein